MGYQSCIHLYGLEITKGKDKGSYLSNVPKNAFNMTSTWHINDAFDIWLQHEYKSDRKRYSTVQTVGDAATIYNATGNKLKGYNLFNLGTSYTVNNNLRINGSINNLLDKDFTSNGTYLTTTNESASYYDYMVIGSGMSGTYLAGRQSGYQFRTISKIQNPHKKPCLCRVFLYNNIINHLVTIRYITSSNIPFYSILRIVNSNST